MKEHNSKPLVVILEYNIVEECVKKDITYFFERFSAFEKYKEKKKLFL